MQHDENNLEIDFNSCWTSTEKKVFVFSSLKDGFLQNIWRLR